MRLVEKTGQHNAGDDGAIARELRRVVRLLNGAGVRHGDLNPTNILVKEHHRSVKAKGRPVVGVVLRPYRVVLADFSWAVVEEETELKDKESRRLGDFAKWWTALARHCNSPYKRPTPSIQDSAFASSFFRRDVDTYAAEAIIKDLTSTSSSPQMDMHGGISTESIELRSARFQSSDS